VSSLFAHDDSIRPDTPQDLGDHRLRLAIDEGDDLAGRLLFDLVCLKGTETRHDRRFGGAAHGI